MYQTSSKDLATKEDFDLLAKEAKAVAAVYKAKEKYDALKIEDDEEKGKNSDDESVNLVKDAMEEEVKEKAEEAKKVVEEAVSEAEEVEEKVEKSEE